MTSEFVVPDSWRSQGWTAAINGVPAVHTQRTVVPGDFYQPYNGNRQPPSVPQGHVLALAPLLGTFAWPFPLSHFQQMYLPRLRDRRWRLGAHLVTAPGHLVCGPEHGEICIHVAASQHLSHEELVSYMQRLDRPPRWGSLTPTSLNREHVATFVSEARNSGFRTVLSPAPSFPGHFLVLLVSERARILRGVPLAADGALYPRHRFQQGDVLDPSHGFPQPLPDSSDLDNDVEMVTQAYPATPSVAVPIADRTRPLTPREEEEQAEATALIQTRCRLIQAISDQNLQLAEPAGQSTLPTAPEPAKPNARVVSSLSIPTPFGRRRLPAPEAPVNRTQPAVPTVLAIADLVPAPRPCIAWGVNHDVVQAGLTAHNLHDLSGDLSALRPELKPFTTAWCCLPQWQPGEPVLELSLYTDGSFFPDQACATWAVVVLGRTVDGWCRIGFLAEKVQYHQEQHPSAFEGEVEALLHAFAIACRTEVSIVHVGCDCEAAILAVSGHRVLPTRNLARRALAGLAHFLRCAGRQVNLRKVEAHSGDAFNDMADALAKQVGKNNCSSPWAFTPADFRSAVEEGVFERAWLTSPHAVQLFGVPPLLANGTWAHSAQKPATHGLEYHPLGMEPVAMQPEGSKLRLKVLQYNVLSLKGLTARALLAKGARSQSFDLAGFQETREQRDGFSCFEGWWIVSAPSTAEGTGGVQVWINPANAELNWDRKSLTILHSTPQSLILLAKVNGINLAIVTAHAPTAVSPPHVLLQWWGGLQTAMQRIPRKCCVITCIDANARFSQEVERPRTLAAQPICRNSRHLADFACAQGLEVTDQFDCLGSKLVSWTSPGGHTSLLDYILFPKEWQEAAQTLPTPRLGDLYCDRDHDPVALLLDVHCQSDAEPPPLRIDPAALLTPAGAAVARRALETVPPIPWEWDSTLHTDIVNQHLARCLRELPPAPPKPRNPALSQDTIRLVVNKRHMQRCLKVVKKRTALLAQWLLFKAWRDGSVTAHDVKSMERAKACEMQRVLLFQEARAELTQSMLQDKANFARRAFQQARDAGPREFAYKLRSVLRTGRKFRAPPLIPVIKVGSSTKVGREDVLDSFADHFAGPERATCVQTRELVSAPFQHLEGPHLDGEKLPSVIQLAGAFARLKPAKAPGITKLPSELFRTLPMQSACIFWPVFAKSVLRDPFPMQWRGGAAVAVPKQGKAADSLEGYRSVLLLEPPAKAVQSAYRPMLHEAFLAVRTQVHFGGVAGAPISLPAACAKAHLLHLDATHTNGGAIFIDCKAAYYSVSREVLQATPSQLADDEWMQQRARIFFDCPAEREKFITALRKHTAPGALRDRPEIAAVLRSQLQRTWFVTRPEAGTARCAESGTVPGSPVADLMFGLVFQRFLELINHRLSELGCAAFSDFLEPGELPPTTPTWADDVCILFAAASASMLEPALKEIMRTVLQEMRRQGLEANLGQGKSEAIVIAHGTGAQAVRRRLFTQDVPAVALETDRGQTEVRLVPDYTHLGCVLTADGSDTACLQYREQQALAMLGPIRRRLLPNPYLSETEKLMLFKSRVVSSFMHGAGMLVLRTARETSKFEDTLHRMYRSVFRPIVSVSSKGYSNLEVASVLGLALPEELLMVARARTLAELVRAGLYPVLRCLAAEGTWWSAACRAARSIGMLPEGEDSFDAVATGILLPAQDVSHACRRFLRKRCQERAFDRNQLVSREAPDEAVLLAAAGPSLPWRCHLCPAAFQGRRHLSVHLSKHHGQRPLHVTSAFGSTCQKCLVEFWSLRRLTEHLRRSDRCRSSYVACDIEEDCPARTRCELAWRPATRVAGPQPWWATLEPPVA